MTFSAEVRVETDVLQAIQEAAQQAPRVFPAAYISATRGLRVRLLARLTEEPGPPVYPIRWKTIKQRRAFFATDGFGRGIPTQRTGALQVGWRIEVNETDEGGVLEAFNDVSYTRYVQGFDQQPFHIDTGWPYAPQVIANAEDEAEDILIETWFSTIDGLTS